MGFTQVQTMVFWNYHEREMGHFEFTELEDYPKMAHEMGSWVIVSPCPYIRAESERGSFPQWVIADRFALRSKNPQSFATSKYWCDHFLPVIRPYQITYGGPIILIQLENEYDFWPLPDSEKREYCTS